MDKTKKSNQLLKVLALSVATVIVGILPFLPVPDEPVIGLSAFLGRFHPLILHFPIVLILLLNVIELWRFFQKDSADKVNPKLLYGLLITACLSSFVTAIAGFLLYRSEEYQGAIIQNHLWGGVAISIAANLAVAGFWLFRSKGATRYFRGYQFSLLFAGLATIYTSHLGGSITHGSNFLTEPLAALQAKNEVERKAPQDLLVYEDIVQPILENRCLSCHNTYKTKGGFLMSSLASIQKGGKSGKEMLVAHQPASSELFRRITLPTVDDEHMPPKEKPDLSVDEVTLIQWWIQEGANDEMVLGFTPPDSIALLMQRYLPTLYRSERLKLQREKEQAKLAGELADFGKDLGLIIEPDEDGLFAVSMELPPKRVDDETIGKLLDYGDLLSKISLPGAEITDDAFYDFSRMSNLRHLYLPKTCVKGTGLAYLKRLQDLRSVNLSYSFLSNEGMLHLNQFPALEEFYLFGTEVDSVILGTVKEHLPEVKILKEEGPYY
jgi:uncharacterized membrane protein